MNVNIRARGFELLGCSLRLYPVDQCKLPIGKWVLGAVNYVMTPMGRDEAERRVKNPRVFDWAVLCGNPAIKVFTLDVERAGMDDPEIVSVLESNSGFPRTALMCVELLQQMVVTLLTQQFRGRCIKPV